MKAFRKKQFNMVELAIAIAIVAIGVASTMTIIPLSLKTSTETKTKYYASDITDIANSFAEGVLAGNWSNIMSKLPETKETTMIKNTGTNKNWDITKWPWDNSNMAQKNIYAIKDHEGKILNGVYGLKLASNTGINSVSDIKAELKIWKTPENSLNPDFGEVTTNADDIDINKLVGVNMEISCPADKPYEQREKFAYYFEVFNYEGNSINPSDCTYTGPTTQTVGEDPNPPEAGEELENPPPDDPNIEKGEDNEIIINRTSTLRINIIASELCSGSWHAPVYVRVCVKEPDDENPEGTVYNCFEGKKYLYDMTTDLSSDAYKRTGSSIKEIVAVPGDTWEIEVPSGSTYKIWAGYYYNYYNYTYARYSYYGSEIGFLVHSYWSTNDNQVYTLLNGDEPTRFADPGPYQLSPEECIQEYMNDNGEVTLADTQVLYLFELSNTSQGSGFDMQDMIILADITEN